MLNYLIKKYKLNNLIKFESDPDIKITNEIVPKTGLKMLRRMSSVRNLHDEEKLIQTAHNEKTADTIFFLELIKKFKDESNEKSCQNIMKTINKYFIEENALWQINTTQQNRKTVLEKSKLDIKIDKTLYDQIENEITKSFKENTYARYKKSEMNNK